MLKQPGGTWANEIGHLISKNTFEKYRESHKLKFLNNLIVLSRKKRQFLVIKEFI